MWQTPLIGCDRNSPTPLLGAVSLFQQLLLQSQQPLPHRTSWAFDVAAEQSQLSTPEAKVPNWTYSGPVRMQQRRSHPSSTDAGASTTNGIIFDTHIAIWKPHRFSSTALIEKSPTSFVQETSLYQQLHMHRPLIQMMTSNKDTWGLAGLHVSCMSATVARNVLTNH